MAPPSYNWEPLREVAFALPSGPLNLNRPCESLRALQSETMAKKITGYIKLQVPAGTANPAPPIGPALGQRGVNIMEFCKAFNAATQELEKGAPIPTVITVYADRSFSFATKTPAGLVPPEEGGADPEGLGGDRQGRAQARSSARSCARSPRSR